MSGGASILHADLDAFYASVEQRDDPGLRGRPVIVGAGVVLAASYEAKAFGVRTAMSGGQARRLCPRAVVVPPRMSAYSEASTAVFAVFRATTPLVEGLSIDEAFLDVDGLRRPPADIAGRLRREIAEEVGLPITVGVARTKFLAKVASGVAKPDGLLVVPPDGELEFLHPLPVRRLWGVGRPPPASSPGSASPRSGTWPPCRRPRSCRCSAPERDATCAPWRSTATRARCAPGRGGGRWARSGRSAAAGGHRRSWTRCWSASSTGWAGGCARPGACAGR
ncbi:Y-family DNA polymerase [Actinomadura madurae]|uniref:Y-family DNA polymerase n=1 Tax=Actinomadura madurae TaxID=1993 RepID=UPI0020D2566D|nr:hypothetical protein [Actinomadura madurae]MCQ0012206.1 hypothetical protein [Actinomadura madurae]